MKRRSLMQFAAASAGSLACSQLMVGCSQSNDMATNTTATRWRMPDEAAPHKRTWMAFGASRQIWGQRLLPGVQDNLASIAKAIAQFEPVYMLVREADYELAMRQCGPSVNLVKAPLDDLWMRDIGPVFVQHEQGALGGIDFNFNGWGNKQTHHHDAKVADLVTQQTGVKPINTELILEGGAIEVDGQGNALITESSVLNDNRNPGMSKADFEARLMPLLGLRKIIWLPGIRGHDITDGHVDFYARFVRPGVVVAGYEPDPTFFDHEVTKENIRLLQAATDADGQQLEVVVIEGPSTIRPDFETSDFAAGYINFYVINGAVIVPEFGDAIADQKAKSTLQDLFSDREIIQLNIDAIAAGGGGIHCTTQQEPQG